MNYLVLDNARGLHFIIYSAVFLHLHTGIFSRKLLIMAPCCSSPGHLRADEKFTGK